VQHGLLAESIRTDVVAPVLKLKEESVPTMELVSLYPVVVVAVHPRPFLSLVLMLPSCA
jgi:hypothetical protein